VGIELGQVLGLGARVRLGLLGLTMAMAATTAMPSAGGCGYLDCGVALHAVLGASPPIGTFGDAVES
jgi:hypothetical protein